MTPWGLPYSTIVDDVTGEDPGVPEELAGVEVNAFSWMFFNRKPRPNVTSVGAISALISIEHDYISSAIIEPYSYQTLLLPEAPRGAALGFYRYGRGGTE